VTRSARRLLRTGAVGVVLPVHNEEDLLRDSLEAITDACAPIAGAGIPCRTVIVLDHCVDASAKISRDWVKELRRRGGSHQALVRRSPGVGVGQARRTGSSALLRRLVGTDSRRIWLATTDADSRVPENWLTVQVAAHECGADIWSGRVVVEDWSSHHPHTERRWHQAYDRETTPIHGANLGFNARAYLHAGGFSVRHSGEDRALHQAIVARGGCAFENGEVKVVTSGRKTGRAPFGFSTALSTLDDDPGTVAVPVL
jgi:glycosyltransferase involved in cell wall biosynthesis